MTSALVIGATGFVGSAIASNLRAAGFEVGGLSRSEKGDATLKALGVEPVRGDLEDLDPILRIVKDFDAVMFAPQLTFDPEKKIVGDFLERLKPNQSFVFTSGTSVVAERTDGEWCHDSYAEDEPFIPSKYFAPRLVTEDMIRNAGREGRVRGFVVRPPTIWGHGRCRTIQSFYDSAVKTGTVCYLGRGLNLYGSVHVDDLAEIYRLAATQGTPGALYHSTTWEVDNRTVAREVAAVLDVPTRSIDLGEAIEIWGKPTAIMSMSCCGRTRSVRTRKELKWSPKYIDMLEDVPHPAYRQNAARPVV